MKKKYIHLLILAAVSVFCLTACREVEKIDDNIRIPGLGGKEPSEAEMNDLDRWLKTQFVDTYNIEVIYRWEAVQMYSRFDRKLVPIAYERVEPAMEAIGSVWFEPYRILKGKEFLLQYAPKTVVLVGSAEWDDSGKVLGQAEGGNKITLLDLNDIDPSKSADLKKMMHVIEHEFAHILHQTVPFSPAYSEITPSDYNASGWYNVKEADAFKLGFISSYAVSSDSEDFVEMISLIMVNGRDWFENTVIKGAQGDLDPATPSVGVTALRAKLAIVENYLLDVWGINFFDKDGEKGIVTLVQEAIAAIAK